MSKSILGVVAAMLLMFAGMTDAAELKVGVIDPARLMSESPSADVVRQKLEEEFAAQRRDLMAQQNEFKSLQEKFQRDAEVMSSSERANMENRLRELGRDIQYRQQTLAEDIRRRQNEELGAMQHQLKQAISKFAEANGYDLILSGGVAFASDAVDVTDEVLAQMKK